MDQLKCKGEQAKKWEALEKNIVLSKHDDRNMDF